MQYRKEAERIMIAVGSDKMNFIKITLTIEQGFLTIKDNVHSLKISLYFNFFPSTSFK